MLFWTAVIAIATLAYVVVSTRLLIINRDTLRLTRDMFNATNRPFLSIEQVASHPSGPNATRAEHIFVQLKNVGNLPAKNIVANCTLTIDNKKPPFTIIPGEGITLFPTAHASLAIKFDNPETISSALEERSSIDMILEITYNAISEKKFSTKSHHAYNYTLGGFKVIDATWI